MNRYFRIVEVMYIVVAIFLAYRAIEGWNENRSKSYVILALCVASLIMFFIRRRFRVKRMEKEEE